MCPVLTLVLLPTVHLTSIVDPQNQGALISASTEGVTSLCVAPSSSVHELLDATKTKTIAPVEAEI